eukprot:TRINITY_DN40336_c0_g1_i1.p1 TRINITY_DN40336_c0_g1~~TRINITY_DN40336_c0_g1_i1.p1  ORF type:complete len:120 (+),score=17.36 TRINITY_DN40336_c0_g1_i1:99-458(+)
MAASDGQQPIVTDVGHELWRDKTYKRGDKVSVSGVSNLPDDTMLVCVAYHYGQDLFVLRDGAAKMWGVSAEKMRPWRELQLTHDWQVVEAGVSVPSGAEYRIDMETGKNMARLPAGSAK